MSKLKLSLAIGNHDLTQALTQGQIGVEGVELLVSTIHDSNDRHQRLMNMEFDAGEFSMCSHIVAHAKGYPFTAIPVFPHRRFPHSNFIVNINSGINSPTDLKGKRIGVNSLQTTWTLWSGGILEEHYGIPFEDLRWFAHCRNVVDSAVPKGIPLSALPTGKSLDAALLDGDVDMVTGPQIQPSIRNGSPKVKRLFPDFKSEEMQYYSKTGIFPVMHVMIIKRRILEGHLWIARNLLDAFDKAKQACYGLMEGSWFLNLVWYRALLEEERKFFGKDIWAYDLKDNETNIATMIRYACQQGMIDKQMAVSDLFVEPVGN